MQESDGLVFMFCFSVYVRMCVCVRAGLGTLGAQKSQVLFLHGKIQELNLDYQGPCPSTPEPSQDSPSEARGPMFLWGKHISCCWCSPEQAHFVPKEITQKKRT